eukprot:ANDGO_03998.mRNA.1 hypothetical protein
MSAVGCLLTGAAFGTLLHKSTVADPNVIREQMKFKRWTMMQMFLSATATGSFALHFMTQFASFSPKNLNVPRNVFGGLALGAGMAASGACPGTVLAQLGAGVPSAPYTLLGSLFGAMTFGVAAGFMPQYTLFAESNLGPARLPSSFLLPFAVACAAIVWAVRRYLVPAEERKKDDKEWSDFSISKASWSPWAAGALVGLLQIPSVFFLMSPLGTSSAYVTVAAHALKSIFGYSNSYLKAFELSPKHSLQMMFNVGIAAGAFFASRLSKQQQKTEKKPLSTKDKLRAFIGGALILAGARLADGCTSGMGLSTTSQLGLAGFLTVASMFAGGLASSFLQ